MREKNDSTHILIPNALTLYQRERSGVWQCRYKVAGVWQRASTKEHNLKKAKERAKEILIEAEIRERSNLPVVTRRFRDVAKLAIERMEDETTAGHGKAIYKDYIGVINNYLIPALGKRVITNVDYSALDELDAYRIEKMGKAPSQSTLLTHNAALNRVFDEAVIRGLLTDANRPKLETKAGGSSDRRPAFELKELQAVLGNFDAWIKAARTPESYERRELMRDYVEMLVDTGARPGVELLNLKWKQIKFLLNPQSKRTGDMAAEDGEEPEEIVLHTLNRSVEMTVSGKTGTRQIIGRQPSVKVLERIARRNYGIKDSVADPFKKLITPKNDDYVFRTKEEKLDVSESFQKMLETFLADHNLLIDPKTDQKRVFYSFRHTYATLALTHDKVPIHTLAKQMGTSVGMIEKHYSHLKVLQAIDQLQGQETRKLIASSSVVDDVYKSKRAKKK